MNRHALAAREIVGLRLDVGHLPAQVPLRPFRGFQDDGPAPRAQGLPDLLVDDDDELEGGMLSACDRVAYLPQLTAVDTGDAGHDEIDSTVLERLVLLGGRDQQRHTAAVFRKTLHVVAEHADLSLADAPRLPGVPYLGKEHAGAVRLPPQNPHPRGLENGPVK